jgi:methionyl-tRNA synthetase
MFLIWLQRLLEKRVIFITGTDEHGEKIATSAEASGRNPKEQCDIISNSYKTLWADVCHNTTNFLFTNMLQIWSSCFSYNFVSSCS